MLQQEHSSILLTFIKLAFVIKIFVLSIFEWPLKTGFTVVRYKVKKNPQNLDLRYKTDIDSHHIDGYTEVV